MSSRATDSAITILNPYPYRNVQIVVSGCQTLAEVCSDHVMSFIHELFPHALLNRRLDHFPLSFFSFLTPELPSMKLPIHE